jgi:hypothetical protein
MWPEWDMILYSDLFVPCTENSFDLKTLLSEQHYN